MTNLTQRFIDLSDIISFRLECRHDGCGAKVVVPLAALESVKPSHPLSHCPSCNEPWLLGGQNFGLGATHYDALLSTIVKTVNEIAKAPMGCSVMLEIGPDSPMGSSELR